MSCRPFSGVVVFVLCCCIVPSARLEAQGSAKALIAELESGDSTRCIDAGNATSEHQEHYQQLAAELAVPLFNILEKGPCPGSALTALVNVGPGIVDGIDAGRAIAALVKVVEQGLEPSASPDAASIAGSAVLVIGHFGAAGAPAVPVLKRWIFERPFESFDRSYGLRALASIGDASAPVVPALLPLLAAPAEDDEQAWQKNELRNDVVRTLGWIPAAAAASAPALVAALGDADYGFRNGAIDSITKIGAPMVPHLLPALETSNAETKQAVLKILAAMGAVAADAAPAIAPLLGDEDWNVTYQAGEALRQIGPTPAGIAALVKVVGQDGKEDAARTAAEILGGYGSAAKDALPALRKAAASGKWSLADAAKTAIAAIESGG